MKIKKIHVVYLLVILFIISLFTIWVFILNNSEIIHKNRHTDGISLDKIENNFLCFKGKSYYVCRKKLDVGISIVNLIDYNYKENVELLNSKIKQTENILSSMGL